MNKEYFEANVVFVIEVEYEMGGRNRQTVTGVAEFNKVTDFLTKQNDLIISDIDYAAKQPDEKVRKLLNTAWYNFQNNRDWCKQHNLTSLYAVVGYIVDNYLS